MAEYAIMTAWLMKSWRQCLILMTDLALGMFINSSETHGIFCFVRRAAFVCVEK